MQIENKNLYWPMELAFLVVFCYNFGHKLKNKKLWTRFLNFQLLSLSH